MAANKSLNDLRYQYYASALGIPITAAMNQAISDLEYKALDTGALSGVGGTAIITDPIWNAKGDLAVASGDNAGAILPVGTTNGHSLQVDNTAAYGIKWGASTELKAHLVDPTDAHDSSAVSVIPQGQQTGIDAQAAINNLDTRVAASLQNGPAFLSNYCLLWDDFFGAGATSVSGNVGSLGWQTTVTNGGVVEPATSPNTDAPGQYYIRTGNTSATAQGIIFTNPQDLCGAPSFTMEWRAATVSLQAAGTQEFQITFGLGNTPGVIPSNGFWFEYNIGNLTWQCRTGKAGTRSQNDSGVTVDTNWHHFRITSDGGGLIYFFIDGTQVAGPISGATIPGNADVYCPVAEIFKTVGLANRTLKVDYFYLLWAVTR